MNLHLYNSIDADGNAPSSLLIESLCPWVERDDTQGIKVCSIGHHAGAVNYSIAYDATTTEATLTATTTTTSTTGDAAELPLNVETELEAGEYTVILKRVTTANTGTLTFRPLLVKNNPVAGQDVTTDATVETPIFLYASAALTIDAITCINDGVATYETSLGDALAYSDTLTPAESMSAGDFLVLWIKRSFSDGIGIGEDVAKIQIDYDDGTERTITLQGAYVATDATITPYRLYASATIPGVVTGGLTVDTSDDPSAPTEIPSLPYQIDLGAIQDDFHGVGIDLFTLRFGLRSATTAGVESQNQLLNHAITLEYGVGDVSKPNAPVIDTLEILEGGYVRLVVTHDQDGGLSRATYLIAECNGESITEYLSATIDETETEIIFSVPIAWGETVNITVTAYDADDRASDESTDSTTATWVYTGGYGAMSPAPVTAMLPVFSDVYAEEFFYQGPGTSGKVATIRSAPGYTAIFSDTDLIFEARIMPDRRLKIFSDIYLWGGTGSIYAAAGTTDPIIIKASGWMYLCAGEYKIALANPGNYIICERFDTTNLDCPLSGPYVQHNDVTYWQVFDNISNRWRPFMAVDKTNDCLHFALNMEFE